MSLFNLCYYFCLFFPASFFPSPFLYMSLHHHSFSFSHSSFVSPVLHPLSFYASLQFFLHSSPSSFLSSLLFFSPIFFLETTKYILASFPGRRRPRFSHSFAFPPFFHFSGLALPSLLGSTSLFLFHL